MLLFLKKYNCKHMLSDTKFRVSNLQKILIWLYLITIENIKVLTADKVFFLSH